VNRPYDMPYDPKIHHRRSIRLPGYDYSQTGAYFVTICAHQKKHLFGEVIEGEIKTNEIGEMIRLYWNHLPRRYPNVELDEFVLMPNHIHGIIRIVRAVHEPPLPPNAVKFVRGAIRESPLRRKMLLAKIIGYFKMNTAKRINEIRGVAGVPVWQRNYYEHIVRNNDELNKIRDYIATNPLRWPTDPENLI
jgi:REP element-mobilizing transposase RayT